MRPGSLRKPSRASSSDGAEAGDEAGVFPPAERSSGYAPVISAEEAVDSAEQAMDCEEKAMDCAKEDAGLLPAGTASGLLP